MDMHRRRGSAGSQRSSEEAAINGALESLEKDHEGEEQARAPASQPSASGVPRTASMIEVPADGENVVQTAAEGMTTPKNKDKPAPVANPFWSPQAHAELELQRARPSDLDEQARRIEAVSQHLGERPASEGHRHRLEVRLDDQVIEPVCSPPTVEN